MNSNTRLYKTVSASELANFDINISRQYCYITDKDVKEIKEQPFENNSNNKQFELVDEDYEWNPKLNDLIMSVHLSIKNVDGIFGKEGSCYEDAEIGIGIIWNPEQSRIKRCKKIGVFKKGDRNLEFNISDIVLENISSNVAFKLLFYIHKPGTKNGSPFFANEQGMIIFEQIAWMIIVKGSGSIFPIQEIEDENGPLWTYMCDVYDIAGDFFDEQHIQIQINKKHSAYEFINSKSENFNIKMLNEIMSSALSAVVIELRSKEENNRIDLSQDCENGSVLQALKYFCEKLGFKINDTYVELYKSIKMFFDKECQL